LGFTYEEKQRIENFQLSERNNLLPVLIDLKITNSHCFNIIQSVGLKLPNIYTLGYPNANCIGCVKATSPTYWNLVREKHPKVFKERSAQSRSIGCRLTRVKGKRIFLDELKITDKGQKLKNMDFECGIFCEEL
jgi:hypothetical protein